jgi:inner membrane protein
MDPVTHVTTGLLVSQLIPSPCRWLSALAGVLFALLPDLDYLLFWSDRLAYIRYHRGISHSLLMVPVAALTVAVLGQAVGGARWFRPLFFLGLAVLALHLLLDLATSYGTQLFSPFSPQKLTLDWLFIIDPYISGLFAVGAAAALVSPDWGRKVGAVCLALAGGYLLLCGFYHHQALALAREVYRREAAQGATTAALPQPLSCRRWQLIAAGPGQVKQALVQLPYLPFVQAARAAKETMVPATFTNPCPQAPAVSYQPPWDLQVLAWRAPSSPPVRLSPEAQRILSIYLDFARFPLLFWAEPWEDGVLLQWLDLRFSAPGHAYPFVLQLFLDSQGRLERWQVGGPCVDPRKR